MDVPLFTRMFPLIAMLVLLITPVADAVALEEPDYELISSNESFEIRRYAPFLVAEVTVEGGFSDSGNEAFRILANYIFGGNRQATKMAMTAPVISESSDTSEAMAMTAPVISTAESADGSAYVYAFVMESKYTLETLPVPDDSRIRIIERPARMTAAHHYSGRWTESNYSKHEALLFTALTEAGIDFVRPASFARYNSPFRPSFMRRNEVLVEIVTGPVESGLTGRADNGLPRRILRSELD